MISDAEDQATRGAVTIAAMIASLLGGDARRRKEPDGRAGKQHLISSPASDGLDAIRRADMTWQFVSVELSCSLSTFGAGPTRQSP
jgi:hypothetical protein